MAAARARNPAPKILVADPHAETAEMYGHILGLSDGELTHASDGSDALAKVFEHPYPLVITETHLPIVDGYTFCDIVRNNPITRATSILVATADSNPIALKRALEAGADAALAKPFTPEMLLAEAQRLMLWSAKLRTQSHAAHEDAVALVDRTTSLLERITNTRPTRGSQSDARFATSFPPLTPPHLRCPSCDGALLYGQSQIGSAGASDAEQWDDYRCPNGCGSFQYRQRTRKLSPV
jgi:CheY-like chemotaxis protein